MNRFVLLTAAALLVLYAREGKMMLQDTYIHTLLNAPKKAFQQQFTIKMMKINSYIEKN
jgi:hypothetical protein